MAERLIVRSYRRVFQVDRRIYRVDRWVLPVPGRGPAARLAYFAVALLAVVLAGRLPVLGGLVGELAAPLRYVVRAARGRAAGNAGGAGRAGRASLRVGLAVLADALAAGARRAARCRWRASRWRGTASVATGWDESAPLLHRGRVAGPAMVTFGVPVEVAPCRRGRVVARRDGRRRGRRRGGDRRRRGRSRCGDERPAGALRAPEHPCRPRRCRARRCFGVASISYPFMAGARQARVAAAAGALRVLGGGRLLAVARQPRLSRRALRRAGAGDARRAPSGPGGVAVLPGGA